MTAINKITREDADDFRRDIRKPAYLEKPTNAIDAYQEIAGKSAIYPGKGTPIGLAYVALKMNGEAGEFAEHVGKAMRDDGLMRLDVAVDEDLNEEPVIRGELKPERRTALLKEAGDQLWYIAAACRELGATLSEVMAMNLDKLADRTERDALRGSGDER